MCRRLAEALGGAGAVGGAKRLAVAVGVVVDDQCAVLRDRVALAGIRVGAAPCAMTFGVTWK